MKRQATGLEKISVTHILDKRHVSTMYKEFSKLEKMKNLTLKNAKNVNNKHFMEENIQMVTKHVKRRSTSWPSGKCRLKTTIRCYYANTRMAKIRKTNFPKCWGCCGEMGTSRKWNWNYESTLAIFENVELIPAIYPAIPPRGICTRGNASMYLCRDVYMDIHILWITIFCNI